MVQPSGIVQDGIQQDGIQPGQTASATGEFKGTSTENPAIVGLAVPNPQILISAVESKQIVGTSTQVS